MAELSSQAATAAKQTLVYTVPWFQHIDPFYVLLVESATILILTIMVSALVFVSAYGMNSKLEKSSRLWDDVLIKSFHTPLQLIVWVAGIAFIIDTFSPLLANLGIISTVNSIRSVVIIISIIWGILRFIKKLEYGFMTAPTVAETDNKKKRRINKTVAFAMSRILRIVTALVGGIIILQVVGIPVSALLAVGGAGTLVVGLAAQSTLSNFFGGLMIYLDRPFSIGDWIRSPDRNIEGTVEEISWRLTRIRTFDSRLLYVPNSVFSTISIENPSRMIARRINTTFGVRYDDAHVIEPIRDEIAEMLKSDPKINSRMTQYVRLTEMGESSLNITIYAFTTTTVWLEFMQTQEEILLNIMKIVGKHGAEIAFPTRTLELPKGVAVNSQTQQQSTGDKP